MNPRPKKLQITEIFTTLLIYGRPPLIFCGMIMAVSVMWTRNPILYEIGLILFLVPMCFDLVDGWFATRFHPHSTMTHIADRVMDKIVYSMMFPLVSVGAMWRLIHLTSDPSRGEMLHAIFVMLLGITVMLRDNFAHFVRFFAQRQGLEPESKEFSRLRTTVAAPVGTLLYAFVFYTPAEQGLLSGFTSWLADIPLQVMFFVEIIFLVINFASIAGYCRKYGTYCLDEVCDENERLRRKILSFFPNTMTLMNAAMGLMALFFAHQYRMKEAYLFIMGAALFDKLDGALARRLGLTEPLPGDNQAPRIQLGSLLDDISDGISFCIVPGLIFYLLTSRSGMPGLLKLPLGLVAGFYIAMGIVRLIYFTLDRNPIPGFFKGMPTPAAALLTMAPMMMFTQALGGEAHWARFWGTFSFGIMAFAGVLMNLYPIHYLHFGRFIDSHSWFGRINWLLVFVFLFTPWFGYFALTCLGLYVFSPFITHRLESSSQLPGNEPGTQT